MRVVSQRYVRSGRRPHHRRRWPRLRVACKDPARRALTRLKVSSGGGPALLLRPGLATCSAFGSRSGPAPPRAGRDLAVTLHLTCPGVVRPRGERDDRSGRPPRRAAGPGRAVIANPAAREVGVWPMRPGLIDPPPLPPVRRPAPPLHVPLQPVVPRRSAHDGPVSYHRAWPAARQRRTALPSADGQASPGRLRADRVGL